jgi:hypothetical protein
MDKAQEYSIHRPVLPSDLIAFQHLLVYKERLHPLELQTFLANGVTQK